MRFSALKSRNAHTCFFLSHARIWCAAGGGGMYERQALLAGLLCGNDDFRGSSLSAFLCSHSTYHIPSTLLTPWGMLYACPATFSLVEFCPLPFALIPPGRGNKRT